MRTLWKTLVPCASLLLAACTSAEFNRNADAPAYPPYKGEVEVLEVLPPPDRFERLGVVLVTGGDAGTKNALLRDLKKAAAANGANAIMLQRDTVQERGTRGVGTQTRLAAWALRIRE